MRPERATGALRHGSSKSPHASVSPMTSSRSPSAGGQRYKDDLGEPATDVLAREPDILAGARERLASALVPLLTPAYLDGLDYIRAHNPDDLPDTSRERTADVTVSPNVNLALEGPGVVSFGGSNDNPALGGGPSGSSSPEVVSTGPGPVDVVALVTVGTPPVGTASVVSSPPVVVDDETNATPRRQRPATNLRGSGLRPAEADPRSSPSDILRTMNLAAWGATVILGLAIGVGCRGAHGEQECVEGCEADAYCSVTGDRDPDGGCQFSASCEARPATCAEQPTCDCLIEQELMRYREQGWSDDEVSVECEGDAASGFTVASSVSANCLPD